MQVVEVKWDEEVKIAVEDACRIVAWAAKSSDPLETSGWIKAIEVRDLGQIEVEDPTMRQDIRGNILNKAEHKIVKVVFEIDIDPRKEFWVETCLVEIPLDRAPERKWWAVSYRSGQPGKWFQKHFPRAYMGTRIITHSTLTNSRRNLEARADEIGIFQFPFRDIPAPVK